MSHTACQCGAWSQLCGAPHVGTRGLCAACITGKCERPPLPTPENPAPAHKAPGTAARLAAVLNDPHPAIRWPAPRS